LLSLQHFFHVFSSPPAIPYPKYHKVGSFLPVNVGLPVFTLLLFAAPRITPEKESPLILATMLLGEFQKRIGLVFQNNFLLWGIPEKGTSFR
jgi:hypothetical protein